MPLIQSFFHRNKETRASRPKAFSLKKNINFAIAPLFFFELHLSSIILLYL